MHGEVVIEHQMLLLLCERSLCCKASHMENQFKCKIFGRSLVAYSHIDVNITNTCIMSLCVLVEALTCGFGL